MKYIFKIILFFIFTYTSNAQLLFYQNTYKGGISVDGKSYYGSDSQLADTISFQNSTIIGSTIKKAFLISNHYLFDTHPDYRDSNLPILFNSSTIVIDSSNIVSSYYSCGGSKIDVIIKDVTSYALLSNNKLITPNQAVLMGNDTSRHYIYYGFLLVVLYENNTMPATNTAIFLNSGNHANPTIYNFPNINPVNTSKDVGLSIWVNDIGPLKDSIGFTINNTNYLGAIYPTVAYGNENTLPGSFYYQNNTLFGLQDDINSPFIRSTNAIANIKNYLPINATGFTLSTNNSVTCMINNFVLAYSTPCPARSNTGNIITYPPICSNGSVQLHGASVGNYTWSASNNSLSNYNIATPTASPTITTNYIALVDSAGCKHTEQHRVDVYTLPKTDSVKTTIGICGSTPGTATIIATVGSPTSYTVNGMVQSSPNYTNLAAGTYTFALSNVIGCTYTSPKAFIIKDTNLARARFYVSPDSGCGPLTVNFTNYSNYDGNNIYSPTTNAYTWYTNGDSAHAANFTYTFADTGKYSVTLLAYETQRKCSATSTQTVLVKYCPPDSIKITVPNVFSPNGDNINETWQPIVHNYNYTINNYECTIYDRWGIKVFSTTNINTAWDGKTTSGLTCNAGTYYYVIKYSASNTIGTIKQEDFKGYLELVR